MFKFKPSTNYENNMTSHLTADTESEQRVFLRHSFLRLTEKSTAFACLPK